MPRVWTLRAAAGVVKPVASVVSVMPLLGLEKLMVQLFCQNVNEALASWLTPVPVLRVIDLLDESMAVIVYSPAVRSGPVTRMPTTRPSVELSWLMMALPATLMPVAVEYDWLT